MLQTVPIEYTYAYMPQYKLTDVSHETPSILSLKMQRLENEQAISFQPGQYATISYRKGMRPSAVRCFSIASTPTDQDHLELGIRVGGKFTHALERLNEGDIVTIDGPYGNFIFDSMSDTDVVMCAGGIGITPFMSMMRYATKLDLPNNIHLLFSARSQDDIPYFKELERIAHENKNIKITFVIDSGPTDKIKHPFHSKNGRIDEKILLDVPVERLSSTSYFICGPPPFMKAVVKTLRTHRIADHRIVTEAFSQGPHRQTGRSRAWPANIYALSAVGLAVSTVLILTKDMLKSIPQTMLPKTLKSDTQTATRQSEVDALVQTLDDAGRAALDAAVIGFQAWRTMRGGGNDERRQILDKLAGFLERHGDSRFSDWTADGAAIRDRAGWWKPDDAGGRLYLFNADGLREALKGFDFKRALDVLESCGVIPKASAAGERSKTENVGGRKVRVYPVRADALHGVGNGA